MTTLDVERVDLAELAAAIRSRSESGFAGSVVGRTVMRDVVAHHLHCSVLEAEQLVDTLIGRGFARLDRDATGQEVWLLPAGA